MRTAACLLMIPALALAAPGPAPDVEKVLVQTLAGVDKAVVHDKLGFTKDAMIVVLGGLSWSSTEGTVPELVNHRMGGTSVHKAGKLTIGSDDAAGIAWFQLPYDVTIQPDDGLPTYRSKERLGGLAIKTPGGWQIAGAMFADLISDKALFADPNYRTDVPDYEPNLSGDEAIARVVSGWFQTGFAAHAAATPNLIASGTAPTEFRAGAKTAGLVKAWDKLGLVPFAIEAKSYAGGKAAVAIVTVVMPRKKEKKGISMDLFIVMIRDGTTWKWVSLQFSV